MLTPQQMALLGRIGSNPVSMGSSSPAGVVSPTPGITAAPGAGTVNPNTPKRQNFISPNDLMNLAKPATPVKRFNWSEWIGQQAETAKQNEIRGSGGPQMGASAFPSTPPPNLSGGSIGNTSGWLNYY